MELKNNELAYRMNIIDLVSTPEVQTKTKLEKGKLIEAFVKRTIDILGSICGMLILLPITIAIGLANLAVKDKGPIFYIQERIGKDGKPFKLYKFRSMVIGADEKLEKYLAQNEEARKEYNTYKKLKDDPRVTRVGKFIRRTSLDEFPQFINVLKGEMSLVGPRPYLPKEKEDMGLYYGYIIKNKPGVTGPWQIGGRSDITFNDRLTIDLEYYKNNDVKLYIEILIKTVLKIIKKEGAI